MLRLQDDHTEEVERFVNDIKNFFNVADVKVVIELGSRDAQESIALKNIFTAAEVFAFECNPPAIELCKENIKNSGLKINLVEKAVSDTDGILSFYSIDPLKTITTHADGNIGASSLFQANPEYPYEKYHQNKILVDAIRVQTWAEKENIKKIDIAWVDLQGAELAAFKGMGSILEKIKIVYTEVEFREMYINQPLFGDVDSYLRSKGFELMRVDRYGWFGNAFYINSRFINKKQKLIVRVKGFLAYSLIRLSKLRNKLR